MPREPLPYGNLPPAFIEELGACAPHNRSRAELEIVVPPSSTSNTGITGVYANGHGRYRAKINRGGNHRELGTFDTIDEASAAYTKALVAYQEEAKLDADWHPQRGSDGATAKAICRVCPVRLKCLEWAIEHHEFGIWGGTSERERRAIRKERRAMEAVA